MTQAHTPTLGDYTPEQIAAYLLSVIDQNDKLVAALRAALNNDADWLDRVAALLIEMDKE